MSDNTYFLTADERTKLTRLANRDDIFAKRAQALLSLEFGITQAQAGQKAGLTRDQVRYILSKFRRQRLNAFPDDLIQQEPAEILEEVARSDEKPMKSPGKPQGSSTEEVVALVKKSSTRKKVKKEKPKMKSAKRPTRKEKKLKLKKAQKGKKRPQKKKSKGKSSSRKKGKPKKKATKKRKNK